MHTVTALAIDKGVPRLYYFHVGPTIQPGSQKNLKKVPGKTEISTEMSSSAAQ